MVWEFVLFILSCVLAGLLGVCGGGGARCHLGWLQIHWELVGGLGGGVAGGVGDIVARAHGLL